MIEFMTVITEFVNATLNLYLIYHFFSCFYKKKYGTAFTLIMFLASDILFTFSLLFLKGSIIMYIPAVITAIMIAVLYECTMLQKVIYTAIIFGIIGAIEMIVALILTTAFSLSFEAGKQGVLYIVGMILSKFVVFLIILFIRLKNHSPLVNQYKRNFFGTFLFPLSTFIVMVLQHRIFLSFPSQSQYMYYAVLIAYTLLFLANIIVFDFIDSLYKNTIDESKFAAAEEIIANQTIQYQALIDHNRDIIKLQHDNKNFCIGLISDLEKGNIKASIDKLKRVNDVYLDKSLFYGNIIYSLLEIKRQAANAKNIDISFENQNLDQITIPSTDLAIIIGNALDNAIEECERINSTEKKHINLMVSLKNDTVIIIINNPVSENIDVSSLATKKSDLDHHGFGVISMRQVAAKYNGEVVFSCEGGTFTASIIMNNISSRNE